MSLASRYGQEAPAPRDSDVKETIRYTFDEIQRRAYHSTQGLDDTDINCAPGKGAWSIGQILDHQLFLVRFMIKTLAPDAIGDIAPYKPGPAGSHNLAEIAGEREALNERFRAVWQSTPETALMERRPGLPPSTWADWPILMRLLRPLTDIATHVGQVNYVRRQLGKPVGGS